MVEDHTRRDEIIAGLKGQAELLVLVENLRICHKCELECTHAANMAHNAMSNAQIAANSARTALIKHIGEMTGIGIALPKNQAAVE